MIPRQDDRLVAKIYIERLKENARLIQEHVSSSCQIIAVVKSNAYGYRAAEIASVLEEE